MSIDDRIPRINTQVDGVNIFEIQIADYKFVQLYIEDKPYLRLGSERNLHFEILTNFFRECSNLGHQIYNAEEIAKMCMDYEARPKKLPPLKTDKYHVVGMGIVSLLVFNSGKTMSFGGLSMDFGISPDKLHIEKIIPYLPNGWDKCELYVR